MVYFVSIAALVAVFAIATVRPINMGILGFTAAFLVGGLVSGISLEEVQTYFPGDMFLVVFGITLLFGIARVNGTLDLIMEKALRLVRGKPWAIVWLMFLLAAVLMAVGSVLAVAMLAPIAMPLAKRYGIDPLLMGMMLSHGALSAAFSPITVYAVAIGGLLQDQGITLSPLLLFVVPFLLNLTLATALFFTRGRYLLRDRQSINLDDQPDGHSPDEGPVGGTEVAPSGGGGTATRTSKSTTLVVDPTVSQSRSTTLPVDNWLTFLSMGGLLVAALLGVNVGVTAVCLSAVLLLARPGWVEQAMKSVSWSALLLVCGVVTYIEVMTENGTLNYMSEKASALPWPLLTALVMFVAVALISAVGSSFGIILITLPLAAPMLAQGELGAAGFVIALAFSATVADVSPFSTNGVFVLASAQVDDRQRFQRKMLAYCGLITVVGPLLAWLTVVVPTST